MVIGTNSQFVVDTTSYSLWRDVILSCDTITCSCSIHVCWLLQNFFTHLPCFRHDEWSFHLVLSDLVPRWGLLNWKIPSMVVNVPCITSNISCLGHISSYFFIHEPVSDHESPVFFADNLILFLWYRYALVPFEVFKAYKIFVNFVFNNWHNIFCFLAHMSISIEKLVSLWKVYSVIFDWTDGPHWFGCFLWESSSAQYPMASLVAHIKRVEEKVFLFLKHILNLI